MMRLKNKFCSTFNWFDFVLPWVCPYPPYEIILFNFKLGHNHSLDIPQYLINFAELPCSRRDRFLHYAGQK